MRNLFAFLIAGTAAFACLYAGNASAQVVQEYTYAADRIYPIRTGLGITTQIELSPSEKVVDYSVGFSGGWDLQRRDNLFYLRPKNTDVDTNLMVRTETHTYIFELKVVATDWRALDQAKAAGVQYKVTFRYPEDTRFTQKKADEPAAADTALSAGRAYNYSYDYATRSKEGWLVPVAVYDDGSFTYIRMSDLKGIPTGNFPAVYGRDKARTSDFLVNTTVENNTIIVHGVYPFLIIRHGDDVIGLRRGSQQ
ncbi:MAG: TrbG/VirB9 family P-type conjugative transfer protein [Proteobacteria bacterium]|nr:TrbG/VirB9 family P-type conjugative transfer protein [Pseudomonadota bacterium]MBS0218229.1 TrbG/VirB9 family P-type conjugative transfer protein [Pseudomonadota bacterium]